VAGVVLDRLGVERVQRPEPEPVEAAGHDPVLDVDRGDAAGLQHAHELGRQEVHLLPERRVVLVVAEVVERRRVLVLARERDRRDDQADAVRSISRVSRTESLRTSR
jgi:hypothetical protein